MSTVSGLDRESVLGEIPREEPGSVSSSLLRIDEHAWSILYQMTSLSSAKQSTGKIAVTVINDYGDEDMRIFEV